MKKLITLAISALMVLSLGTTVFAVDGEHVIDSANGSFSQIPVNVKVNSVDTLTTYWIDIKWNELTFEYQFGNKGEWQPSSHTYTNVKPSGWKTGTDTWDVNGATGTISVFNHSNTAVSVSANATLKQDSTVKNVNVDVTSAANFSGTLPTAEDKATDASELKTIFTVKVTGTPSVTSTGDNAVQVANVTVKIQ